MAELHAQAYAFDGPGFYFDSAEDFDKKFAEMEKRGFEEFEIQFIDGDSGDAQLFNALGISQATVGQWFDVIEPLDQGEKATLYYLAENGHDLEEALDIVRSGDRAAQQGSMVDYVYDYIDSIGGIKELGDNAQNYFDYEAFGRDIRLNGEDTVALEEDKRSAEEHEDADEAERIQEEIDRIEALSERELGEELVDSLSWEGIGQNNIEQYFDYEAFAHDIEVGGDRSEFKFADETWTAPSY